MSKKIYCKYDQLKNREQNVCFIQIHYLEDVSVNIHHFDVAFFRVTIRFLLLIRTTNKRKIKRKEEACMKKERKLANKNNVREKKMNNEV